MSSSRYRFAISAGAAAAAGLFSALLALSPTAAADPATPSNPAMPVLNTVQQIFAAPASQLLQNAASALTGVPQTPATPVAAGPLATASGSPPRPATTTAAVPATGASGLVPTGQLNLPKVPGLALPLPDQLSFPGDLASLVGGSIPVPNLGTGSATSAAPAVRVPGVVAPAIGASMPGQTALPLLLPISALP